MEALLVCKVHGACVLRHDRDPAEQVHGLSVAVIFLQCSSQDGVEAGDKRTEKTTCGRAYQATGARARTSRAESGSASSGTDLPTDSADATAGRVLHDADRYTEDLSASLGPQHVRVGDVQVVARDCDIEVILKSQGNRVIQRKIKL